MKSIYLGAGCFWGVQYILADLDGIVSTSVGYMGGHQENPTYQDICTGNSGHAEVVMIQYDEKRISTETILDYFWRLHDPTQLNRQGVDIGTQYRSVIFCEDEEQIKIANESKQSFDAKKVFNTPAVTEIEIAPKYYIAEDYHQDYFIRNPGRICHTLRER